MFNDGPRTEGTGSRYAASRSVFFPRTARDELEGRHFLPRRGYKLCHRDMGPVSRLTRPVGSCWRQLLSGPRSPASRIIH